MNAEIIPPELDRERSIGSQIGMQPQNVTHEGNLLVNNNQTLTIENSAFTIINGTITVEDTSTLIIRNSKLISNPSINDRGKSIVLADQANLIMTNTNAIFTHPMGSFDCEIIVRDNAKADLTSSTFQKLTKVISYMNSVVQICNTTLTTVALSYSGVVTHDDSTAKIVDSTIGGAFVWGNSTVSMKNSTARIVRTGGTTTINIETSEVDRIETFLPVDKPHAPMIYVESSNVESVNVQNATVFLIDCGIGNVRTFGNATVSVGWRLPLIGLIEMPHWWVPYIQLTIVIIVIVILFLVLRVFLRRRSRAMHMRQRMATRIQSYLSIYFPGSVEVRHFLAV